MREYDNEVLRLFKENLSVSKISKMTGLSRQGIYNILQRNGVNYKKKVKSVEPHLLRKDLQHKSIKRVVQDTGVPYHRIKRIMDEHSIEKREIMRDILNVKDVSRLYNECGLDDKQIAQIFNCSQYTVRSFRWKYNIYDKNRLWQERLTKNIYRKLCSEGHSLSEISKITDVPYHTVVKAKKMYEK